MTGSSPTPLDRIEARAREYGDEDTLWIGFPDEYRLALARDVLALVEIAKAAEAALDSMPSDLYGSLWAEPRERLGELRAALDRLQ